MDNLETGANWIQDTERKRWATQIPQINGCEPSYIFLYLRSVPNKCPERSVESCMCTFIIVSPLNTTQPFVRSNIQSPWSTGTKPWFRTSITISVPCSTISLLSVHHDPKAWKITKTSVLLYQNFCVIHFIYLNQIFLLYCYIYGTLKPKMNVNLTNHVYINVHQTAKSMKI